MNADIHEPGSCKEVNAALKAVPNGAYQVLFLPRHEFNHVVERSVSPDSVEDAPCK